MTEYTIALGVLVGGPMLAFILYEMATTWLDAVAYMDRTRS
jgi:hypothetical protein